MWFKNCSLHFQRTQYLFYKYHNVHVFQLSLRRRSDYYHYIYVCPAIMIAFLIPVLFILPAHDTGKLSLGKIICFVYKMV